MAREPSHRHLIADDLGPSKRDSFVERFFTEGLAELERYLAKWAAYRDLAGED